MEKEDSKIGEMTKSEFTLFVKTLLSELIQKDHELLNENTFIPIKKVAQIFQISLVTVYKWIQKNELPAPIKIVGRTYFIRKELEEKIKNYARS